MTDIAIRIENLSKQYRIGGPQARYKTIRESLTKAVGAPFLRLSSVVRGQSSVVSNETIWALKDVSFEVRRGEVVGIIGPNGAGKTTLLKVLTRITEPTAGRAELRGRVGSLLEVGTGFHPELTGRENVYLNGAILGMRKGEVERKFDEIVDFSGVEKFIDTPAKHYSSGMRVRLAFSVAAHLDLEILLVDEVLAVGDAAFQKKCLGKMGDVAGEGRTVLFVSHNMETIVGLCSRAIWLDSGRKSAEGPASQVTRDYLASLKEYWKQLPSLAERTDRDGAGRLRFTGFHLQDERGHPIDCVRSGETVEFVLSYVTPGEWISNVSVQINFRDAYRRILVAFWSPLTGDDFERLPPKGRLVCRVPHFPLMPGTYTVDLGAAVSSHVQSDYGDVVFSAAAVEVVAGDFYRTGRLPVQASFLCEHSWRMEESS